MGREGHQLWTKNGDFENERSSFTESLCIEPASVVFVTYVNQGFYERQRKDSITSSWELWSEGGGRILEV